MRYPAEYKFPGGTLNSSETNSNAAKREFEEEFLTSIPNNCRLRLFKVSQTRPIKGVSYIMSNYVCLESENQWLSCLKSSDINERLRLKRSRFNSKGDDFYRLDDEEKESLSPEVEQVNWLQISEAISYAFTSMNSKPTFINPYQESEFERLNIKKRDPMFVNLTILTALERFKNENELIEYCKGLRWEEEVERVRWLDDGMEIEDVERVLMERDVLRDKSELKT